MTLNTTTQAHAAKLSWLDKVNWTRDAAGQELVPVIAQDQVTGKVLMFAFMNREALRLTVETGHAVYWSRSRNTLWHKGEESGHVQHVHELRLDCDEDVILMTVEQVGGIACHTGRHDCFFQKLENGVWIIDQPVLKNPAEIYRHE